MDTVNGHGHGPEHGAAQYTHASASGTFKLASLADSSYGNGNGNGFRQGIRLHEYDADDTDSPRHSRESSRGLLLNGHRRSSSAGSVDGPASLSGSGVADSGKLKHLGDIDEEDEELQQNDDDEFPSETRRLAKSGHARTTSSANSIAIASVASGLKQIIHDNRGLLMIAIAQGAFACMAVMVKLMTSNAEIAVPVWELIFTRMAITWACCYCYMRYMQVPDPLLGPQKMRGWLVLRGFVGFFGLFGSYTALQYLSLSDATVLGFLSPTVTGILAALFLGEPYTWREVVAGLVSLSGTVLVAQPEFLFGSMGEGEYGITPEERLIAVGVALMGVVGASSAYVTLRKMGREIHSLHGVSYFCMMCTLVSIGMPLILRSQPFVLPSKPIFWFFLLAIGICGFTAQFLLGKAMQQKQNVGRSILGNYMQLPWALVLQYIAFGETMDLLSTLGACIIMGSTVWVVMSKQKEAQAGASGSNNVTPRLSIDTEREAAKLEANALAPSDPGIALPLTPATPMSHKRSTSLAGYVTPDISLSRSSLDEAGKRLAESRQSNLSA